MKYTHFLPVLTLLVFTTHAEALEETNACEVYASCGNCLTESYNCHWCEDQDFTAADPIRPRCNLEKNLINGGCKRIQRNDGSGKKSCDCEKRGVPNSLLCSGMGTFKCGICYCNEGRFGKKCGCDAAKMMDTSPCRSSDSAAECSGFGTCICGKCVCDKRTNPLEVISGQYCECNNFDCERFQGMICGGPERGVCECGKCICKEAYRGDNCGEKNCDVSKPGCLLDGKPSDCGNRGVQNSPLCSGMGTFKCGICYCNEGRFGEKCGCDAAKMMDTTPCRSSDSAAVCSGFGTCICGKCLCDKRTNPLEVITGKYCECNNFACDRYQGMICGGPERGVCECGKCVCKEAYHGDNCGGKNCDLLKASCLLHDKVCSGNGVCNCGSCKCNTGYKGRYCESNIFGSSG